MIPLTVTNGPEKGRVGQLLGYSIESGTDELESAHWALVLLLGTGVPAKLAPIRLEHLEVIMPEVLGDEAAGADENAKPPPVEVVKL